MFACSSVLEKLLFDVKRSRTHDNQYHNFLRLLNNIIIRPEIIATLVLMIILLYGLTWVQLG